MIHNMLPPHNNTSEATTLKRKPRQSNFELFRIFLMLMIIAHHYVVNSGIPAALAEEHTISFNLVWAVLYGWGGKVGIDCFLLITGYFMCKQAFSWRKFLKLFLEIKFYVLLIYAIFVFSGYLSFSWGDLYCKIFSITMGMGKGFTSTYICLYLLVPYINKVVEGCNKRQYEQMLVVLLGMHTVLSTFVPNFYLGILSWYITVYFIGAYIRLYPMEWMQNQHRVVGYCLGVLALAFASIFVIVGFWLTIKGHMPYLRYIYYFVNGENHLLAIASAILFFLVFRNMKMQPNRFINTLASTIFGVFLIHANSDAMRKWLWQDVFDNAGAYATQTFWIHSIAVVALVFITCACIDYLRIIVLECPLFRWLDRTNLK